MRNPFLVQVIKSLQQVLQFVMLEKCHQHVTVAITSVCAFCPIVLAKAGLEALDHSE